MRISDWSSGVCSSDLEGVSAHAFAHSGDLLIVGHDLPHMTILAILTANGFSGGDHRRPYRRGRALRDGLPFEGAFALREQAGAHLLDHLIQRALAEMAHQFGLDASGVHR